MVTRKKIQELCSTIVSGGTPSTQHKEWYDGDIPWLNTKEVKFNKIESTERSITSEGLANCSAKWVPANTVVVAMYGATAGNVAITGIPLTTNQACCNLIINPDVADYRYVYYALMKANKQLKSLANGGAQQNLSVKQIKDFAIPVPCIDEQREIAEILYKLDEKINLNSKINDNLQEQARSLFKAWFVDYIPFGGSKPANWKAGKLKDILLLKRNAIKPGENTELNYLPIDAIPMNTFAVSEVRPNNEAQSSLITFNRDDIIIGAMRIYFHRVIIAPFDGITRTTCFTLCSRSKEYLAFNLLCCDQDSTIEYAQATSRGSTMPYAVWDGGLGEMMIEIPDKAIALEFNEIVLPIIRTIQSSFLENKRLQELRDGLLPRLITGELDVSGLEL